MLGEQRRGPHPSGRIYVPRMTGGTLTRSYGKVFNEVAAEYDRNRPTYPDTLVDHACQLA
jgi:hypothetical protein